MIFMKTRACKGCGLKPLRAASDFCCACQSKLRHAKKRIEAEGLIVDTVRGKNIAPNDPYWIWSAQGDVLVIGKPTKAQAIRALAFGAEEPEVTS